MKQHDPQHAQANRAARSSLAEAFLAMETADECRALLKDLTTPAELEALVDRWRVVRLLDQGLPYREIHDQTGVSVTTVGRVARFLEQGNGGYQLALERLKK
jgi:TrpR-related protein YerC/YecD